MWRESFSYLVVELCDRIAEPQVLGAHTLFILTHEYRKKVEHSLEAYSYAEALQTADFCVRRYQLLSAEAFMLTSQVVDCMAFGRPEDNDAIYMTLHSTSSKKACELILYRQILGDLRLSNHISNRRTLSTLLSVMPAWNQCFGATTPRAADKEILLREWSLSWAADVIGETTASSAVATASPGSYFSTHVSMHVVLSVPQAQTCLPGTSSRVVSRLLLTRCEPY